MSRPGREGLFGPSPRVPRSPLGSSLGSSSDDETYGIDDHLVDDLEDDERWHEAAALLPKSYGTFAGEGGPDREEGWEEVADGQHRVNPHTLSTEAPARKVTIVVGLLTVISATGVMYDLPWWREQNIEYVVHMQEGMEEWMRTAWEHASWLGQEVPQLAAVVVYIGMDYNIGIRLNMLLVWVGYASASLQTATHDCRPFWFHAGVEPIGICEPAWGFPSPHAACAASFWPFLLWEFYFSEHWKLEELVQSSRWRRAAMFGFQVVMAIGVVLVGISRIMLGVNFFYQVLVGWMVGVSVLMCFLMDASQLTQMRLGNGVVTAPRAGLWWEDLNRVALCCVVLPVGLAAVPLITYHSVKTGWSPPTSWNQIGEYTCERSEGKSFAIDGSHAALEAAGSAVLTGALSAVMYWHDRWYPFDTNQGPKILRALRVAVALGLMSIFWHVERNVRGVVHEIDSVSVVFKAVDLVGADLVLLFMTLVMAPVVCVNCCMMEAPVPREDRRRTGLLSNRPPRYVRMPPPSETSVSTRL